MATVYTKKRRTMEEIQVLVAAGDVHAFYVSKEWKAKRIKILNRDNHKCQRCLGKFVFKEPVKRIKLTDAKYVHHIQSLRERFDLALEDDNLVSLCFTCHEIVEGRTGNIIRKKKKPLTEEKW